MVSLACIPASPSSSVADMLSSRIEASTSPDECAGKLLTPNVDPFGPARETLVGGAPKEVLLWPPSTVQ